MKTLSLFVAFGLLSSIAMAGDGEGCPACKPAAKPTALAAARQQIADIPKADAKLPAEQLKEVTAAREFLIQTSFGKAMGPSYESCGRLMLAAAIQPGTPAEAAATMKDMAATYCSLAKMFGACKDCKDCSPGGECAECCKDATPESCAAKAKESLDTVQKLLMKAGEEMPKMTAEQQEKMKAAAMTLQEKSPCWPAIMSATKALNEAYASLAKMGIPATKDAGTRDTLVKGAFQLHSMLAACHEGGECKEEEGCEEQEGFEDEEPMEAPEKSS